MANVLDRLGRIIFMVIMDILVVLITTAVVLSTSISLSCSAMSSSAQ